MWEVGVGLATVKSKERLMSESAFDVMVHLIGEQGLPVAFAILNVPAKSHLLLATAKTEAVARRLAATFATKEMPISIELVDSYDQRRLREAFVALRERHEGKSVAANVTGGTKLMALSLVSAWVGLPCFYVDTSARKVRDVGGEREVFLRKGFSSVEQFVRVNSSSGFVPGTWAIAPEEAALADSLCEHRWGFRGYVGRMADHLADPHKYGPSVLAGDLEAFAQHLTEKTRDPAATKRCVEELGRLRQAQGDWAACRFVTGRWLETYVLNHVKGLPGCYDFQQGASATFQDTSDRQEFDVAFTDGLCLYLVECKSGYVSSEQIQRLSKVVSEYGGTFGRGVLVASAKNLGHTKGNVESDYQNLLTRVEEAGNLMLVELPMSCPDDTVAQAIRNWKPGKWEVKA